MFHIIDILKYLYAPGYIAKSGLARHGISVFLDWQIVQSESGIHFKYNIINDIHVYIMYIIIHIIVYITNEGILSVVYCSCLRH